MTLKNGFGKCSLFILSANGWNVKTWPLGFPAKENPNMDKALFDWPIVLQYDVKAKYQLISRKFSGMKFFHPIVRLTNETTRVCVCLINQSYRSISVRLLFLFCLHIFISRSYENRSILIQILQTGLYTFPYKIHWESMTKDESIFLWWSFYQFSQPFLLIVHWHCREKIAVCHSQDLKG